MIKDKTVKLFSSALLSSAFVFDFGLLTGCESLTKSFLKDPEITVLSVNVTDITLSEISLNVNMNVKNPNSIPLRLDRVTYQLNISGDTVTEGTMTEGIQVPASGENTLRLPLKFKFSSVAGILQGLLQNSFTKEYELKGSAQVGIFSIPFSKRGEVQLKK